MYLKSLSVKNFRKFKDFSVGFPSDITVIKGPNEQGKSTILLAILAGLFYDPKKSNKDIDALKSWGSDALYEMRLDISNQGTDIVLEKNFEKKEILLENNTTDEKLTSFKDVSEYLFKIGSVRSLSLFEKTACVKHDALSSVSKGDREISQALQSLLTSSVEDISTDRILKRVNESLTSLQKGLKSASKTPGELKKINEDIANLEKQKIKLKADLDDLSKKSDYLGSVSMEYYHLKKDYDAKFRQHEMNLNYFKVMDTLEGLNSQYKELDADISVLDDLEKKKEYVVFQLERMNFLKDFNVQDFYKQLNELKDKESKLGLLKKEIKSHQENNSKDEKRKSKTNIILAVLFLILSASGFFNVFLFGFLALSLLFFVLHFSKKKDKVEDKTIAIKKQVSDLDENIKVLSKKIDDVFKKNKVEDMEGLMLEINKYNEFCQDLGKLESKEEGVLRGLSLEELKATKSDILKKIGVEEEKISDEQRANVPTPQEQRLLEIDIEKSEKRIEDLEKEILQVSAVSNQYNVDNEYMVKIEEEIEFLNNRKNSLEKKVLVLGVLAETLKEAQFKIISESRSYIEDYMKKYISTITDGRYNNVKVNDDLTFEVWSDEKKGMLVPEEHLSQGTIDQFYFVVRLAILDVLNKGKRSLVLLDDPFHSFDIDRREKTKQVLTDLTDRFQFILFTHSSDYDSWGEVVEV